MSEKKKKWSVAIPVTGVIYEEVEADSEEEAIDEAMSGSYKTKDIEEWEIHRHVVRGNVFYGHTSHATAEEIE